MKTFRLLATSLLVALGMEVSSCGDEITNEVVQQEPDNTLELLLGTWQGTGEAEGETLTFNKDKTYAEISENTIYTVVKITEDELYLNNNGHSDIVIYNRKP